MEALFKKYFWVVQGIGLAVIAGLAASAVVTQLGTMYALDISSADSDAEGDTDGDEDEDGDKPTKRKRPSSNAFNRAASLGASKRKTAEDVQKHNVFCPNCVPPLEAEAAAAAAAGGAVDLGRPDGIQPGEVKSSLALQLLATMESTDPDFSLATIYDADAQITGAYRRGNPVRSGVVIVGVDTGLVHLRNGAQLEYLTVDDEAPTPARPTSTPSTSKKKDEKKKKKSKYAIDGAEDAINCPDENTCVVERQFVEQLMQNPAMLAKQARIVPSQRDGETQGFKFYGIRRGSLPKLLGLKNGDMLTEVNGEEIRSVDKAMSLAMKLRRASNLSVTLVRKGKQITKEIQIQ